jgi:hypothetical protein
MFRLCSVGASERIGRMAARHWPWRVTKPHRMDRKEKNMLYTIAVVLLVLWLLGLVTSYTMGGFIHVLLVIAVVVILIQFIQGRRL